MFNINKPQYTYLATPLMLVNNNPVLFYAYLLAGLFCVSYILYMYFSHFRKIYNENCSQVKEAVYFIPFRDLRLFNQHGKYTKQVLCEF